MRTQSVLRSRAPAFHPPFDVDESLVESDASVDRALAPRVGPKGDGDPCHDEHRAPERAEVERRSDPGDRPGVHRLGHQHHDCGDHRGPTRPATAPHGKQRESTGANRGKRDTQGVQQQEDQCGGRGRGLSGSDTEEGLVVREQPGHERVDDTAERRGGGTQLCETIPDPDRAL